MYGPAGAFTTVRTPEGIFRSDTRVDIKSCGIMPGVNTAHFLLSTDQLGKMQFCDIDCLWSAHQISPA